MEQREMLPRSQMVAAVVSGTGMTFEKSQLVQITVKLPIYHVAKLDAMARQAGKTRTAMLSLLLAVGLDEVSQHLDETVAEQVLELEAQCMAELQGEA